MMGAVVAYPASPLSAWGAAALKKARAVMDVILHVGAHRTGAASFQHYVTGNTEPLRQRGVTFWGPARTRRGLFDGLLPNPGVTQVRQKRAMGRVRLNCAAQVRKGTQDLIVSDADMLGSVSDNLCHTRLYRGLGERMARVGAAFDGQVGQVFLTIRALDRYWASALAWALPRGGPLPNDAMLDRIVTQPRSWRDVVTDLSCAMPGAQILVMPFEQIAGRPHHQLEYMTHGRFKAPEQGAGTWQGRSAWLPKLRNVVRDRGEDDKNLGQGNGHWTPFDTAQEAALKETYADDLFWLRSGADGLALLIEERAPDMAGELPGGTDEKRIRL